MQLRRGLAAGMVGIGGSGMQGLALLLLARGLQITGSDDGGTTLTLPGARIVSTDELAQQVTALEAVIYSDAIPVTHPVRVAAASAAIPQYSYAEAIGELSRAYTTLAVAGTHGKSSTTALLGHILVTAGYDPTVLVGAAVPDWGNRHARVGASSYLVVEADEYLNHYFELSPHSIIITTIDWDHPDFFSTPAAVWQSFESFVSKVPPDGTVLVSAAVFESTRHQIAWPATTQPVAPAPTRIQVPLPGVHMEHNAWLAIQMAGKLGVSETVARAAVTTFQGLSRRFEELKTHGGRLRIISDYAHHPTEVAATLAAVHEELGREKVAVLFEPHTWSRLEEYGDAFTAAFRAGGLPVVVCPVYEARGERRKFPEALEKLVSDLSSAGLLLSHLSDYDSLPAVLKDLGGQFTAAVAFTAGSLDGHLRRILRV